jgi:Ca2+-binding EF-hand superfamily protein
MKQEFEAIDTDGSRWIDKSQLKAYAMKMKYDFTEEELDDLTYNMDTNQNDKISMDEFIAGMVGLSLLCSHRFTTERCSFLLTNSFVLGRFLYEKAAARAGYANYVINDEMYLMKIEADFKEIDQDGNGFINKQELREMGKKVQYYLSEDELESIMKDMDEDQDGKITLEEFIAATVSITAPDRACSCDIHFACLNSTFLWSVSLR